MTHLNMIAKLILFFKISFKKIKQYILHVSYIIIYYKYLYFLRYISLRHEKCACVIRLPCFVVSTAFNSFSCQYYYVYLFCIEISVRIYVC